MRSYSRENGHVEIWRRMPEDIDKAIAAGNDCPVTSRRARALGLTGSLQMKVREGSCVYVREYSDRSRMDHHFVATGKGLVRVTEVFN